MNKILKFIATNLLIFFLSFSAFADEENYIIKTKPKTDFTVIKQPCYVDVDANDEDGVTTGNGNYCTLRL